MNAFNEQEGKDWLVSLLKSGTVEVKFEKLDGTERLMVCTLKEENIPKDHLPKGTRSKNSSDSLAVYDTQIGGWRSFRFDSIKEVTF